MIFLRRIFIVLTIFLAISCKPTKTYLANERFTNYRLERTDTLKEDPSVSALIQPYRTKFEAQMNEIIGQAPKELKHEQPLGTMDSWAADLLHRQTMVYYGKPIDFTTINFNGLRIKSIPQGNVTVSKLYELMPFDNALIILEGDSTIMQQYFDKMAGRGGWPIAGATFDFQTKNGVTTATNIKINGAILRGGKNYVFALSDYIANGGDGCDFLKNLPRTTLVKTLRDAFIEGVKADTKAGKLVEPPK